ncbi:MAG: rod shape-determining protein MreD [Alphaproteobacteria bacterium]|nr:rod shape-determining protein MreD [Alphaproteobacteria bacterium]
MTETLQGRVRRIGAALAPALLLLLLVFIDLLPLGGGRLGSTMPLLTVVATYYFALRVPGAVPPLALFAIGLLQDALTGGPPGLGAVLLVGVHGAVVSQRRVLSRGSFVVEWAGLVVITLGAALMSWVLASAYYGAPLDPGALAIAVLLTLAIYPAAVWALARFQRRFARVA